MPAGDIGVGGREIGFLFGQYKKLRNEFTGVLTGKGLNWGGSLIRPEATGYGAVYFAAEMLATRGESLEGKTCLVSGGGNVAQYATEKVLDLGGKVVTLSDSGGYIYDEEGHRPRQARLGHGPQERAPRPHQGVRREVQECRLYGDRRQPRSQPDVGSQGRLRLPERHPERGQHAPDAANLLKNGVYVVSEGANMPTVIGWRQPVFLDAGILYGPGKAANAGGVAVRAWRCRRTACATAGPAKRSTASLHGIMKAIHKAALETAEEYGTPGNYVNGANIAGFLKVADSMMDQGVV